MGASRRVAHRIEQYSWWEFHESFIDFCWCKCEGVTGEPRDWQPPDRGYRRLVAITATQDIWRLTYKPLAWSHRLPLGERSTFTPLPWLKRVIIINNLLRMLRLTANYAIDLDSLILIFVQNLLVCFPSASCDDALLRCCSPMKLFSLASCLIWIGSAEHRVFGTCQTGQPNWCTAGASDTVTALQSTVHSFSFVVLTLTFLLPRINFLRCILDQDSLLVYIGYAISGESHWLLEWARRPCQGPTHVKCLAART